MTGTITAEGYGARAEITSDGVVRVHTKGEVKLLDLAGNPLAGNITTTNLDQLRKILAKIEFGEQVPEGPCKGMYYVEADKPDECWLVKPADEPGFYSYGGRKRAAAYLRAVNANWHEQGLPQLEIISRGAREAIRDYDELTELKKSFNARSPHYMLSSPAEIVDQCHHRFTQKTPRHTLQEENYCLRLGCEVSHLMPG